MTTPLPTTAKSPRAARRPATAAKRPARAGAGSVKPPRGKPAGKAPVAPVPPAPKASTKAAPKTAVPEPAAPATPKRRAKLVRDSFTMPQVDFALIDVLKLRALNFKRPTKKSEVLRAGLQVLAALSREELQQALSRLPPLKTGRPKNGG